MPDRVRLQRMLNSPSAMIEGLSVVPGVEVEVRVLQLAYAPVSTVSNCRGHEGDESRACKAGENVSLRTQLQASPSPLAGPSPGTRRGDRCGGDSAVPAAGDQRSAGHHLAGIKHLLGTLTSTHYHRWGRRSYWGGRGLRRAAPGFPPPPRRGHLSGTRVVVQRTGVDQHLGQTRR